jgi:hypothetical protein
LGEGAPALGGLGGPREVGELGRGGGGGALLGRVRRPRKKGGSGVGRQGKGRGLGLFISFLFIYFLFSLLFLFSQIIVFESRIQIFNEFELMPKHNNSTQKYASTCYATIKDPLRVLFYEDYADIKQK